MGIYLVVCMDKTNFNYLKNELLKVVMSRKQVITVSINPIWYSSFRKTMLK